jgi:hypothetical protein
MLLRKARVRQTKTVFDLNFLAGYCFLSILGWGIWQSSLGFQEANMKAIKIVLLLLLLFHQVSSLKFLARLLF